MSTPPTLAEIQEQLTAFRDARDWRQFHNLRNLAAAISVEAAELQEHLLWVDDDEREAVVLEHRRSEIEAELADVIIQCLNFANVAGTRLNAPGVGGGLSTVACRAKGD